MDLINGTLVVQACNFFLAYCILRAFLLKPAVELIEKENGYKRGLASAIDAMSRTLELTEMHKQQSWYAFQHDLKPKIPLVALSSYRTHQAVPPIAYQRLTESEVSAMADDVAAGLIERIGNVRW